MNLHRDSTPAIIDTVVRSQDLVFRKVRYADGFEMPLHSHEEPHLFLCLAGTIEHRYTPQTSRLTPATLSFVPGEEPHANCFGEGVETFDIVLTNQWMQRVHSAAPSMTRPIEYREGAPVGLAMRMYQELRRADNLTSLMLEGLTLELLTLLARGGKESQSALPAPWLTRAKDYLQAHFTESLSLSEIAAAVGVHPDHLTRAFRKHYRMTIGDYIRQRRIEHACQLLKRSSASLAQIAQESGFADQSHFQKNFKAQMKITPAQFRATTGSKADSGTNTLL